MCFVIKMCFLYTNKFFIYKKCFFDVAATSPRRRRKNSQRRHELLQPSRSFDGLSTSSMYCDSRCASNTTLCDQTVRKYESNDRNVLLQDRPNLSRHWCHTYQNT